MILLLSKVEAATCKYCSKDLKKYNSKCYSM
jgi:hypothetical protein